MLLVSAGPAFALDQSVHEAISHDSCRDAGLPQDFCERLGTEAYNVDDYEWSDPAAHAQIDNDALDSACTAANAVLDRERTLGSDIRDSLYELAVSPSEDLRIHIATQLGRSLHTIQDDCAHHGMPNAQHAWWSRLDSCSGSKTSPDAQPEAQTCARTETAAVLVAFKQQMASAGISANDLDDLSEGWTHWPKRSDVCAFLREADQWDGVDRRWNNTVVVPRLREQLIHAITLDDRSVVDACTVNLVVEGPHARLDVSSPPPMCLKLKTYCLATGGKADGEADAPPPWDDGADELSAGCSVGSDGSMPYAGLLLTMFGVAFIARRRRR